MSICIDIQSNYSDNESICSKSREDFDNREDYMDYLLYKGINFIFDEDGYKVPKVNSISYIWWPHEEDLIEKFDPNSYCYGMWRDPQSYVNFWNKYFIDFYKDMHSKKDDANLFKLYLKFKDVVKEIIYNGYTEVYTNSDADQITNYYEAEEQELEDFEPVKYSKQKPTVTKYINKYQLNTLPEYSRKYFNKKVTTNKTIIAPVTTRIKRKP